MKHKLTRRLGALLLTFAMALTLVVPAWADDPTGDLGITVEANDSFRSYTAGGVEYSTLVITNPAGYLTVTQVSDGTSTTDFDASKYDVQWDITSGDDVISALRPTLANDKFGVQADAVGTATVTVTVTEKADTVTPPATPKTDTKEIQVAVVPGIEITPPNTATLTPGDTFRFDAELDPGNVVDPSGSPYEITWSSSAENVATVDETGTVTAKAVGTADIRAEAGGHYVTCPVTVNAANIGVTGVTLHQSGSSGVEAKELALQVTETAQLTALVAPENATNRAVSWSSSDTNVATVDQTGKVTARKVGGADITVTTQDGGFTASCKVNVTAQGIKGVYISQFTKNNPLILDPNQTYQLIGGVTPEGAPQTLNWSSEDGETASVDENGLVTAKAIGETTITAAAGGYTAECTVQVSGAVVDTSKIQTTMYINDDQPVTVHSYGNAAKAPTRCTWTSSNPSVVSVSSAGRILARGYGTARITLTYTANGKTYPVVNDSFEITVVENSGAIYYGNATAGAPYVFTDIMSNLNTICRNVNGYGLRFITNVMVPTSEGVLYYNHVSSDDTGFGVGATERYYYDENTVGERYMSGLTFVPNSDFNGTTTITYTGYDTQGKTFLGKIRLEVTGSGNVTYITKSGQPAVFSSTSFSAACRSETGREISSVSFVLPAESRGTLYYGYTGAGSYRYTVTEGEQYYRSRTPYLDQVCFVPAEYYIGTLTMNFYGEDTAGNRFTGRLHIIVSPNRPDGERKELTTTALRGTTVDFDRFNFSAACQAALGQSLSYVRFTPPSSSAGTLYYNYSSSGRYDGLVNANTRYYPGRSPRLSDVTFVPAAGRVAPVTIDFQGYSTSGQSFNGTVTIYYRDSDDNGDVIHYAVTSGQAIPFEPADFTDLCQSITGQTLNRIVFQYLPDSTEGTLYYNYNSSSSTGTRVTTSTNLYRSSLSGVAFAPRSDFIGTVELEFTGYTSDGTRFTGLVRIEVEEGNATLRYNAVSGSYVSFDGDDFNDICRQATDNKLNYVRFQLPPSSQGSLYCRTSSSSSNRNPVRTSTNYYYDSTGTNRLDNVLFAAASNFTGTARIDYTGFSTSGARFTGTLEIRVSYPRGTVLSYTSDALPFTIPGSDLTSACGAALERSLSYILITSLPSSEEGRLYYDYVGQGTGTEVKTSTKYYPDREPNLRRLVFVPKAGFEGTVSLPYTAYDTRGDSVSGSVDITVIQATTSVFTDMARYVWAIPSVDFLYSSGVVKGTGSNRYDPVSNVRRCDFVLMLTRMYNLKAAGTKSFDDVRQDQYYSAAIASAKAQNVVTAENGRFRPEEPITREDAMVYLYNAMRAAGQTVPAGSSSELYYFADYNSVTTGARNAITSMIHMGILLGDDYRRINPASSITRAETAAILHRAMTV